MIHPNTSAKPTLNNFLSNQHTFSPASLNHGSSFLPSTPSYRPGSQFLKSSENVSSPKATTLGSLTHSKFKQRSDSEMELEIQDSNLSLSKVLTKIQQSEEEEKNRHQYRPGQSKISKVVMKQ